MARSNRHDRRTEGSGWFLVCGRARDCARGVLGAGPLYPAAHVTSNGNGTHPGELWDLSQLAAFLRVKRRTLYTGVWRTIPRIKATPGARPLFDPLAVRRWLEERGRDRRTVAANAAHDEEPLR